MWSDYIKPELITQFEEENHCQIIVDTYDSNESMYAKLKLGASGYDIVMPSNYYVEIMLKQQMLQKLDAAQLPNLKHLDPDYINLIGKEALTYCVPYTIAIAGLAYRGDKITHFEPTWNIFARKDLKGRMTMLNEIREAIGAGLIYLGYNINTDQPEQIDAAADQLIKWKQNLAKFESEQYKNGIASAEFLVSQGYSGDVLQIMQENPGVDFAYAKEGVILSSDFLAIPKEARNLSLAYAFINFLLQPEVAAQNIQFTLYLAPNKSAYPLLGDLQHNPVLFAPQEILDKAQLVRNVGDAAPLYNRAWDKIKSR